ncbi:hypothetical protein A0H81_14411 [Grifola frondosa]|uniref:Uncharacterized protein n=1 Tax=Grifola frondosa TaxID=5627 RepID=A0A1C7LLR2_GRIFR|nr:hypothetical protein A0H81_14411 [Grifola frondosa]
MFSSDAELTLTTEPSNFDADVFNQGAHEDLPKRRWNKDWFRPRISKRRNIADEEEFLDSFLPESDPNNLILRDMRDYFYHLDTELQTFGKPEAKPRLQRNEGESSLEFNARVCSELYAGRWARPELDVDEALRMAQSQRDALRDEIEELHNVPEHLLSTIQDRLAHCFARVPDPNGHTRSHFPDYWITREVALLMFEVHSMHASWQIIIDELTDLQELGETGQVRLDMKGLFDDLELGDSSLTFPIFQRLCVAVKLLGHILDNRLQNAIATSPAFTPYIVRSGGRGFGYPQYHRKVGPSVPQDPESNMEQYLLSFCTLRIYVPTDGLYKALTTASPTEKAGISQFLYDAIGDQAVIQELRNALLATILNMPLRHLDEAAPRMEHIFRHCWYPMNIDLYNVMLGTSQSRRCIKLVSSMNDLRDPGRFSALWDLFESAFFQWSGRSAVRVDCYGRLFCFFMVPLPPADTAPADANDATATSRSEPRVFDPNSLCVADVAQARVMSGRSFISEQKKMKQKKRYSIASQSPTVSDDDRVHSEDSGKAHTHTTNVKHASGRKLPEVLRQYLDSDDEPADPNVKKGHLKWADFEKAMSALGFQVKQSAGSSVRFDPSDRIGGHPITFHRPHPDPVLNPHLIRRVGYRLRRRFGWAENEPLLGRKT